MGAVGDVSGVSSMDGGMGVEEGPGSDDSETPVVVPVTSTWPPEMLRVESSTPPVDAGSSAETFVNMFRGSSPYINMHSGETMVLHITSVVLSQRDYFIQLMDDLALIKLLGVRLVLVVSTRSQVDTRLQELNMPVMYSGDFRVYDEATLQILKEVTGLARAEVRLVGLQCGN